MLLVTVVLAVLVIWSGVLPATVINAAQAGAEALVENLANYVGAIL
jgi:NADH:ubiquinone oxidoreductase subunit 4 (subunit M)